MHTCTVARALRYTVVSRLARTVNRTTAHPLMTDFHNTLFSAGWWISVVFVGLLINLVSAYIKSPIDKLGSKLSSAWRNRTERSVRRLIAAVNGAVADPSNLAHLQFRALSNRSKSNGWLIFICICFVAMALDEILVALGQMHGQPFENVRVPMPRGPLFPGIFISVAAIGLLRATFAAIDDETVIRLTRLELDRRSV